MPKDTQEEAPKIHTKKHLARQQKENRQKKTLLISLIAILGAIFLLVVYGLLNDTVLKPKKPVAKVNQTIISVDQFQKRVKYERFSLTQTFLQYALSDFAYFFQSQLLGVQNQLDDYITFGESVLDTMIQEELVEQMAAEMGITVSEDELNFFIQENFGYFANGTPTPAPTEKIYPTSTLSGTQMALITATPIPTEMPTEIAATATLEPTLTPTVEITGDTTEAETEAPTATLAPPTETPTEFPTATEIPPTPTEYTFEGFTGVYATMVANLTTETGFNEVDFRDYVLNSLLQQKVFEELTKDISADQEMVWARHILVATEPEARLILTRLKEGDDWTDLAAQLSTDTSNSANGGDLGWFGKGQMVEEFETAAFALEIGEVSEPIKTTFGYHIIQVIGHEVRTLNSEELNTIKSAAYSKAIEQAKTEAEIKKFNVWASVVPSEPSIPANYRIAQ
jgi:parvulin-like peptidyl-prolyl isomerase